MNKRFKVKYIRLNTKEIYEVEVSHYKTEAEIKEQELKQDIKIISIKEM